MHFKITVVPNRVQVHLGINTRPWPIQTPHLPLNAQLRAQRTTTLQHQHQYRIPPTCPFPAHLPPESNMASNISTSTNLHPWLTTSVSSRIQQIIGVFLYYSRNVDETMQCTLNKLASRQGEPHYDLEKDIDSALCSNSS